jgi:hypothetical protein
MLGAVGIFLSELEHLPAVLAFPHSDRTLAYGDVLDELANGESHVDGRFPARDVHVDNPVVVDRDSDCLVAEGFNFAGTQAISPDAFITRASVNSPTLVPLINRFFRPVTAHDGLSTGRRPIPSPHIKLIPIMQRLVTQGACDVRPCLREDCHV